MKKVIILILVVVKSFYSFGQNIVDVVYLKNGSISKGVITEQVLGEYLKLQTADGIISTFMMSEVDRLSKEVPNQKMMTDAPNMGQMLVQEPVLIKRPFYFEIMGAYSFSWLGRFNDATGMDGTLKSSYQAGLGFTFAVSKNIGIETGASYIFMGGNEYSKTLSNGSVNGKVDLDYIQIPFLIKYDFLNGMKYPKGRSAGLKTGLQMGINTRAEDHVSSFILSSATNYNTTTDFDANRNLDWVIGLYGYTGISGFAVNFNLGLNDVMKSIDSSINFKNRNITFSYSLRF